MTIKSIIDEYNTNEISLECLFCDIEPALEALNDTGKDDAPGPSVMSNIRQRTKQIVDHLIALINKAFSYLYNSTTKILQTDHGFSDQFRQAVKKQKPLQAVKLIVYNYQDGFLEQEMSKWDNVIQKIIRGIRTDMKSLSLSGNANELDMKASDLTASVLKQIGAPSNVTDMGLYFLHLKRTFRKEKVERLFKSSELRNYYNMTQGCEKLKTVIQTKQSFMRESTQRIKNTLSLVTESHRVNDGMRKRVIKQSSNVTTLCNMYTSFLKAYTQLKTEEILSYRAVCKKLLRF